MMCIHSLFSYLCSNFRKHKQAVTKFSYIFKMKSRMCLTAVKYETYLSVFLQERKHNIIYYYDNSQ